MDLFRLDGNVAVITGAGGGIGLAYAEAMADAGAGVVCADIDEQSAQITCERLANGAPRMAIRTDVTDEADVDRLFEETIANLGRLDVVFCNAGIVLADEKPFPESRLVDWKRSMDVNLTGVWLTARAAARVMIGQQQGGRIITTASIYGLVGSFEPSSGSYQAAKGAVVNMTRDLAGVLAPYGINVTAIAPAFIRTGLGSGRLRTPLTEEGKILEDEVVRRTPLGRVGDVQDLKGVAVFLASRASSYVTGAIIPVDGGWLAL